MISMEVREQAENPACFMHIQGQTSALRFFLDSTGESAGNNPKEMPFSESSSRTSKKSCLIEFFKNQV